MILDLTLSTKGGTSAEKVSLPYLSLIQDFLHHPEDVRVLGISLDIPPKSLTLGLCFEFQTPTILRSADLGATCASYHISLSSLALTVLSEAIRRGC